MPPRTTTDEIAAGVLAVLAGTPLPRAAAGAGVPALDLADAVETYQAAGRAILDTQTSPNGWYQVYVQFASWDAAEQVAANHLAPQLHHAQQAGTLGEWWFIRKAPCWRFRFQLGPTSTDADLRAAIGAILDTLTDTGLTQRWWETIYEPETLAFGGPPGIDVAHRLFHADSIGILDFLHHATAPEEPTIGRRELSILLCTALFRAAGQDWHEQGDIWHRVATMRLPINDEPPTQLQRLADTVYRLVAADTNPASLFGPHGSLSFARPWATAFTDAGAHLSTAANDGALQRGIRDILAHHVIFHWNRLGLSARTQALLAHAARHTMLGLSHARAGADL
jgi:thiopeptide-type bacteriocin biosynthesis protein